MKKLLRSFVLLLAALMMPTMAVADNYVQGDADGNGIVNMDDLTDLINYLLTGQWPDAPVPEGCVDLGLPSGTMWATHNVGATNPEDYGDYFAWGDIVPNKEYYWWETTAWVYTENGHIYFIKYNTDSEYGEVDNKLELDPEDDAAYVNWGSEWRMPSSAQINELVANCTWEWTQVNGVNGQLVTAPNGNTMFLPAAGSCLGYNLNDVGTYGHYWGRDLYAQTPTMIHPTYAVKLYMASGALQCSAANRDFGYPVRAVHVSTIVQTGDCMRGDADTDGDVDMDDLATLINYLLINQWPEPEPIEYYVDLGLPSGTLWATRNVGANKPEDYGDYFAWGETETKDIYWWRNYQWVEVDGTSHMTYIKYNTKENLGPVDNKTELDPEDDAAFVNWGPEWRMPNWEQIHELLENCTWEWTQKNGVNGELVTGPNGNSIFLPAAGIRLDYDLDYAGERGSYWGRSLQILGTSVVITGNGDGFGFDSEFDPENYIQGGGSRCIGCSVRPVRAI